MTATPVRSGLLCIVSGPSGSGKTTLCCAASAAEGCSYTVSATTRAPRSGEVDGRDYHFLSTDEFRRRVATGEFLEWATVFGKCYGTLRSEVEPRLRRGEDVLMDLDVQGARLMRSHPDELVRSAHFDVFLLPPSLTELQARLAGRSSDAAEVQAWRLAAALEEISHWREYDYTLLSATREEDLARFRGILASERLRSARRRRLEGYDETQSCSLP